MAPTESDAGNDDKISLADLPADRIVLVVDRGLIRLAKVSAFVLAAFAAIGVAFFNFDIYQASERVSDEIEEVSKIRKELKVQLSKEIEALSKKRKELETESTNISSLINKQKKELEEFKSLTRNEFIDFKLLQFCG